MSVATARVPGGASLVRDVAAAEPPREAGVWLMFDKSKRIAIIRIVEVRGRRLLRSVTFDPDPSQRILIGYFPEGRDAARVRVHVVRVHPRPRALRPSNRR